jgi:hypothetical protein
MSIRFRKILFVFVFIFGAFLLTNRVYAGSISITSGNESTLTGEQELTLTATPSGFPTSQSLIVKGAFYKDDPSPNYFGYIKNGSNWIQVDASGNKGSLPQISVDLGSFQITVKSEFTDTGFTNYGDGLYKLKIGYYTSLSDDIVQWSEPISVTLIAPPTPTPTPSPTPTPTPGPTSTPTATPTKTPTPTLKPTKTPFPTPTDEPLPTDDPSLTTTTEPTPSPTPIVATVKGSSSINPKVVITLAFVGVGSGILAMVTLISTIQKIRNNKSQKQEVD